MQRRANSLRPSTHRGILRLSASLLTRRGQKDYCGYRGPFFVVDMIMTYDNSYYTILFWGTPTFGSKDLFDFVRALQQPFQSRRCTEVHSPISLSRRFLFITLLATNPPTPTPQGYITQTTWCKETLAIHQTPLEMQLRPFFTDVCGCVCVLEAPRYPPLNHFLLLFCLSQIEVDTSWLIRLINTVRA